MHKTHPDIMPDEMARKLSDLAVEHGYGIEHLRINWVTKDLGCPAIARVEYATDELPLNDKPKDEDPDMNRGDKIFEKWSLTQEQMNKLADDIQAGRIVYREEKESASRASKK